MKKFGRKLFLSCAALAACATTLVSTTFAWYTSNTEVSTNAVTGTSSASGEGLLMISKDGTDGSFGPSVTLDINSTSLIPVQYTAGDNAAPTFDAWDATTNAAGAAATEGTSYLKFDLYFRGNRLNAQSKYEGVPVYIKTMVLTNTNASSLTVKPILNYTGMPSGVTDATDTEYTTDILRTINIAYVTYEETSETGYAHKTTTYASAGVWNPQGLCTINDFFTGMSGQNAHAYYNAIKNTTISTTNPLTATDLTTSSTVSLGNTPASTNSGNDLKVSFYIFINGWDLECFDAVQGQSISLQLEFTTQETTIGTTISE